MRFNIKVGAVRSGKSYVDIAYIIPARLDAVRNEPGLVAIFGVSNATIERNVLQPMREIYGKALVGDIRNQSGTAYIFGEEVYCIGVEKVSSVGFFLILR